MFEEGVLQRLSGLDLYAGHAVPGLFVDENSLGDGHAPGVWTSPHDMIFNSYEARNSLSPAVPPSCGVDTDGDGQADCDDTDDDGDGVTDGSDCAPLDDSASADTTPPVATTGEPLPPLLAQYLREYAATGCPPAYLPLPSAESET